VLVPARLGRGFRWLLASSWLTYLGDGMTLAAGPLLVAAQTHSPLIVAMAARAPCPTAGSNGASRLG
jgi:membrane protein YqaA with SNARE-associated domain